MGLGGIGDLDPDDAMMLAAMLGEGGSGSADDGDDGQSIGRGRARGGGKAKGKGKKKRGKAGKQGRAAAIRAAARARAQPPAARGAPEHAGAGGRAQTPPDSPSCAAVPAVGQRVLVQPHGYTGVVRYYGDTHYASGSFVGIELEEPMGKNNGTVKGQVYFSCAPKHGLMVRPSDVVSRS